MDLVAYGFWRTPSNNAQGYEPVYSVVEINYIPQYQQGQNQFDYVQRINKSFGNGALFLSEKEASSYADELAQNFAHVIFIGCFNCPAPVEVFEFLSQSKKK